MTAYAKGQLGVVDRDEIADFLYREARLLDECRFEEWLALFTQDCCYWVPASWGQDDPLNQVSLYYEDHDLLKLRVMRLQHPRTENMRPAPRTLHQIGNIQIDEIGSEGATCRVSSALTMIEYRLSHNRIFAARCLHDLRREQMDWKIVQKRVDLIDCDSDAGFVRFTIPF